MSERFLHYSLIIQHSYALIFLTSKVPILTATAAATIKVIDYFKAQKKKNVAETAKAKEEIINGIKEYDAMHSEEEGGNEDE